MKYHNLERKSFGNHLKYILALMGVVMMFLTLTSCEKELDVKTDFPFEVQVMPVPKSVGIGETITIRCTLKSEGNYVGTQYYIRYFQFDGQGKLMLENIQVLKPNDALPLINKQFQLFYTSESNVTQAFDVWVYDNLGNEKQLSFQFNSSD